MQLSAGSAAETAAACDATATSRSTGTSRSARTAGASLAATGIETAEDIALQGAARTGAHRDAGAGLTVEVLPVALLTTVDPAVAALEDAKKERIL
jgi:hypothetical protein